MRSFVASFLILASLITAWGIYNHYSDKMLHGFIRDIDENILSTVAAENWDKADRDFERLSLEWHTYKNAATFFFSTDDINDADYSIARSKYYIKAKDVSNATGELSCLKEQLTFLHFNESVSVENIF